MSEYKWILQNQDYYTVESLIDVLSELDIYFEHHEKEPYSEEKLDHAYSLTHSLWNNYHKPYTEKKKSVFRYLNPLNIFSSLRRSK